MTSTGSAIIWPRQVVWASSTSGILAAARPVPLPVFEAAARPVSLLGLEAALRPELG